MSYSYVLSYWVRGQLVINRPRVVVIMKCCNLHVFDLCLSNSWTIIINVQVATTPTFNIWIPLGLPK
ncbi:hypothetical protein QVD17_30330 [Tagetes erecta]|uniref:Uncharacterized protein n=1 Tax=Tagetes erecta TaxID=13708 RepID=A0AAD8K2J0_TARER|nr:hypothetical protein QVD17_30330 [Tagetes erecta]